MYSIYASELIFFSHFDITLKLIFLSIFCRFFRYFVGTNDTLVGLRVPTNITAYTYNTLTFGESMYVRASRASELRNFSLFDILKVTFL